MRVLFGEVEKPIPQPTQQLQPAMTPAAAAVFQHAVRGHGTSQTLMADEMISWLADTGPEYMHRTLYSFIRVEDGKSNIMYAIKGNEIIGFVIFAILAKRIHVERIAINPVHRRCGAGRFLLRVVRDTLTPYRETAIVNVPTKCLQAQLFFKRCGWKATGEEKDRIRFEVKFRQHEPNHPH